MHFLVRNRISSQNNNLACHQRLASSIVVASNAPSVLCMCSMSRLARPWPRPAAPGGGQRHHAMMALTASIWENGNEMSRVSCTVLEVPHEAFEEGQVSWIGRLR